MSFNRCNYDTCQYKQVLAESIGPGHYMINTPPISCEPCYPFDPTVRLQSSGASIDTTKNMIDIDSEMLNITRAYSKCPSKKWITKCSNCQNSFVGEPCGQGVSTTCNPCKNNLKPGERCPDSYSSGLKHWKDCFVPPEDTRTSNPACNLRGTGWNRWEWLCLDPQERIEMPFDYNIDNRIIVKDNHRPCIPTPVDPRPTLPIPQELPCETTENTCGNYTIPPSVQWRNCQQIKEY